MLLWTRIGAYFFGARGIRTRDLSVIMLLCIARDSLFVAHRFFQHIVALVEFYQCVKFRVASSTDDGLRDFFRQKRVLPLARADCTSRGPTP